MNPPPPTRPLAWLQPGEDFPPVTEAWTDDDPAPGLLAAGGALDVDSLLRAYSHGIFPWFSDGQPPLWWSPHPRMVLRTSEFRLHNSLKKELRALLRNHRLEIRFDENFRSTIAACANAQRPGQNGTWIVEEMQEAYVRLHEAGNAHSVEAWIDGTRCGGLYAVCIGQMVFGESMFSLRSNASKIALSALVGFCLHHGLPIIDCQQQTQHLASLGASPWQRDAFTRQLGGLTRQPAVPWQFDPIYWNALFNRPPASA